MVEERGTGRERERKKTVVEKRKVEVEEREWRRSVGGVGGTR